MELAPEQRAAISGWIERGAGLPEIQRRLKAEFGIALTYLETRLLADDLKLRIKEPEKPAAPPLLEEPAAPAAPGRLSVTIDQITRPGAMVSGRVTFSDGERGEWYLDTAGRLGLNPSTPGYRPSQQDITAFQAELEHAARSQGF